MKTRNKTADFCESMAQAESRWHIPKREQIRAKSGDCSAFRGGRIYKEPLVEWLREHPAKAGEGQAENLRTEKTRKQIEKLSLEIDTQRGKLVARETVKTFFGEVVSDLFSILDRHLSREVFNLVSRELKNAIGTRGELNTL
jgi:hypothetical protein